ncbi:MAG: ABC transporter ATPase [Bacteroidota bacterium]
MNERIWVYTLSKELSSEQLVDFNDRCRNFVNSWTAHDVSLDASFELYQDRLLIFKVNEDKYNASGCSIDKQVRFVKELEQKFSIELLNRLLIAFVNSNDEIEVVKQSQIAELLKSKVINENTIVFNNTISQSSELTSNWKQPLNKTWLSKYLQNA